MSDTVTVDPLEAGREAYARRAWPEAYRLLLEADGKGGLDPEDLEALALLRPLLLPLEQLCAEAMRAALSPTPRPC